MEEERKIQLDHHHSLDSLSILTSLVTKPSHAEEEKQVAATFSLSEEMHVKQEAVENLIVDPENKLQNEVDDDCDDEDADDNDDDDTNELTNSSVLSPTTARKRGRGILSQTRNTKQFVVYIDGDKFRLLTKNRLFVLKQFGRWSPYVEILAEGSNKPERVVNGFAVLDPNVRYVTRIKPEVMAIWRESENSKLESRHHNRLSSKRFRRSDSLESPSPRKPYQESMSENMKGFETTTQGKIYDSLSSSPITAYEGQGFVIIDESGPILQQPTSATKEKLTPKSFVSHRKGTKSKEAKRDRSTPSQDKFVADDSSTAASLHTTADLDEVDSRADNTFPKGASSIDLSTVYPHLQSSAYVGNAGHTSVSIPDVLAVDIHDIAPLSPLFEPQNFHTPTDARFEYRSQGMIWRILNVAPIRQLTIDLFFNMECHLFEQDTVRVYVAHDIPGMPFLIQAVTFIRRLYDQEICLNWWRRNGAPIYQHVATLEAERYNRLFANSVHQNELRVADQPRLSVLGDEAQHTDGDYFCS
eukprot:TRINITY_DN8278_c0_g1_i4.p1 TRINITY_DN8278_c0_g1~~TRINITY_DN8278_c0_g1_i4.p1  ORF type:complete len:528 (-),score=93.78 TRINITY_DN8278_c0_g1_i4:64-1647(-)